MSWENDSRGKETPTCRYVCLPMTSNDRKRNGQKEKQKTL